AGDITGDEPSTPSKNVYGEYGRRAFAKRGCTASASRFFYCAKASRAEREEGLEGREATRRSDGRAVDIENAYQRTDMRTNHHPTVKPVALMRWLCRLVTPPGGLILDPFTGSGSTGVAAILEGFRYLGIEREPEYVAIAEARIAKASQQPSLWGAL
nr:site-specific DNA-methyltransferase [Phenylobacterium sp.]